MNSLFASVSSHHQALSLLLYPLVNPKFLFFMSLLRLVATFSFIKVSYYYFVIEFYDMHNLLYLLV